MANTATVYARIDPALKSEVESILSQLGITPSSLIQMLYSEIKLTKKVPLSLSIPKKEPVYLNELTEEEFDAEMAKGIDDVKNGRTISMDDFDRYIQEKLGK